MSREKSMATIRNAIAPRPSPDTTQTFNLPETLLEPPKQTKEEKEQQKQQEQTRLQAVKLQKEEERKEEERSNRLTQLLDQLTKTASSVWKNTSVQLESLPTPGSLALPLILLLVFFFLLIPVNGHTRFVWLWLAMTGQAEISGSPSGFAGNPNVNGASGDFSTPVQSNGNLPVTPLVLPQLGTFMTGVSEDYLR